MKEVAVDGCNLPYSHRRWRAGSGGRYER